MFKHTSLTVLMGIGALASVLVMFGMAQSARSDSAPEIGSITPYFGPLGTSVSIRGRGFTGANVVDWGFGKTTIHATGAPTSQTITVRLGRQCPEGETCSAPPSVGNTTIQISNENGTSNTIDFLVTSHGSPSGCYEVTYDGDTPVRTRPLNSCQDATCNLGPCREPEASPSPTPTPQATPTPTPTASADDDDDEEETSGGSSSGSASGSSSSTGSTGSVAGSSSRRGPSAADRAAADFIHNNQVVGVVEQFYTQVYGRKPSHCASHYWKIRARSDKATRAKLLGAMKWQHANGKNPVFASCFNAQGKVAGAKTSSGSFGPHAINRLFRQTHGGQDPTPAQNTFWLKRFADKNTESAMLGAMQWHAINNTGY